MMEKEIDRFVERYRNEIIENVCSFIRIPSIAGEREGIYPYGRACADALDFCGKLAEEKGMYVENYDYYGMEIRPWKNQKGKRLLLAAHADVVPASEKNIYPPFGGTIDKGYIIGRGAVDDKAPLLALFYSLLFLKEEKVYTQCDIRLFAGSHEETDMEDLKYYLERTGQPDFGLVSDDDFPITNGEKGVLLFYLNAEKDSTKLWKELKKDKTGRIFGFTQQEKIGGEFICNIKQETPLCAKLDLRIPFPSSFQEIKKQILKFAEERQLSVSFLKEDEGYYISADKGIPCILTKLYNTYSGMKEKAYIMEGCTYARHFKMGCGFGAGKPGEKKPFPKGHGSAHGADEAQNIEVLMEALRMNIRALLAINEYWKT